MNIHDQADYIIVFTAYAFAAQALLRIILEVWDWIETKQRRRARNKAHDAFVAARVAAREECEERMRREGYWDNFEIQAAMDRAGQQAAPGYRP